MSDILPHVVAWIDSARLYPEGPWLVDPRDYPDYVHLLDEKIQAFDLEAIDKRGASNRLLRWHERGALQPVDNDAFMDKKIQSLPHPVVTENGYAAGFEIATSHTRGYRAQYQDRTSYFSIPIDNGRSWAFVTALFDGHGPSCGGDGIAHMLSEPEGVQTMAESLHEWSQRLGKPWGEMEDSEVENGWQFIMLQLQKMIREKLVDNLHQSHMALQAKSITQTLQQTLKGMQLSSPSGSEPLDLPLTQLEELQLILDSFHSLEGVGSTAIYTLCRADPERDRIDLWVASVGDSWSGLVMANAPHYSLVEEASVANVSFQPDIYRRGGKIQTDDQGVDRLNGQYNLCRSLGDLFIIREWAEVKACVQMRGMSPRASISKITLCQSPSQPGELGFDQVIALVQHCDGMKEDATLSSDQISSYIARAMQSQEDLTSITERLVTRAVEGGSHDNCTLQLMDLRSLASASARKKFYRQLKPSLVFQPSTFYHGFL